MVQRCEDASKIYEKDEEEEDGEDENKELQKQQLQKQWGFLDSKTFVILSFFV